MATLAENNANMTNQTRHPGPPHRLLPLLGKRFSPYVRKARTALNIDIEYRYTRFSIVLPADHLLPTYQEQHKLYDRFLPHLGRYLPPQSTVVDVGANCGDTLAAMYAANGALAYICVEPDDTFFRYLTRNVQRITAADANASIQAIQSLVGKQITGISLEGSGGTKKAIVGAGPAALSSRSLDDILSANQAARVSLLKSDVDGFDYDVIDSASLIIDKHSPLLFFECQLDHAFQKTGYENTIAVLRSKGYSDWVVFDNFGEIILRTNDLGAINQLLDYIWRQNIKRTTRTIFYLDILAAKANDSTLIGKVAADYIASK